jgi:hypothetical protein
MLHTFMNGTAKRSREFWMEGENYGMSDVIGMSWVGKRETG